MNDLQQYFKHDKCPDVVLGNRSLNCLMYADELLVISPSPEGLQQSLDVIHKHAQDVSARVTDAILKPASLHRLQARRRLVDARLRWSRWLINNHASSRHLVRLECCLSIVDRVLPYSPHFSAASRFVWASSKFISLVGGSVCEV